MLTKKVELKISFNSINELQINARLNVIIKHIPAYFSFHCNANPATWDHMMFYSNLATLWVLLFLMALKMCTCVKRMHDLCILQNISHMNHMQPGILTCIHILTLLLSSKSQLKVLAWQEQSFLRHLNLNLALVAVGSTPFPFWCYNVT